jgi:hypothetical protein
LTVRTNKSTKAPLISTEGGRLMTFRSPIRSRDKLQSTWSASLQMVHKWFGYGSGLVSRVHDWPA